MVLRAVDDWEATIERNDAGIQIGADSFALPGGKTCLLLVHGFNDSPRTFERMADLLHQKGLSVYAVRLPGFGVTVQRMNDCQCEQWVETVLDRAERLRKEYDRVVVVGHSLGGAVAIGSLLKKPELFDGVVLLAPAIEVSDLRSPVFPTRFWRRVGDLLLRFSSVYQSPYDRNDCRDPKYRNPAYKCPFATRNIVQQTFRLMDQNLDKAGEITLPVLMVLSRDDQIVDWVAAERYFVQLGSAEKQLVFYDSSGHALTVDYDWKQITDNIFEFSGAPGSGQSERDDDAQ